MLKTDHLKTLHDWLTYAVRLYEEKKIALGQVATVAHDEALYLLLHTLGLPLDSRPEVLKKKLSSVESAKAAQVLKRRIEDRVPAAYLTNEAFLGEYRFYVDERVIIPRSYFLEIIPQQLSHWLPNGLVGVKRAVDVCTGSGCLAILLAHNCLKAKVDAIELSPDAMTVAARNIR
ncbi:MAG TPA: 50S ribosomal protein L3 N(5)-glutamine methyltransferase, partial [Opitutaceae bacterium]|nr:50S ribosomal protein L3 N(5)-glutamine methyltransferase [Opitutaceae bacterium]